MIISTDNSGRKFWHQGLRSGLEGTSGFLAHDLFRLPRTGLAQRYSKIVFSFAISGIMHIFADVGGGLAMRRSGAVQCFVMQAFGIMFEDAVQAVWQFLPGAITGSAISRVATRMIGYVWVAVFMVWSSAVWIYPAMLEMREEDTLLTLGSISPVVFGRS